MFKSLVRCTTFCGQFRSSLIVLPVHFFGRSIPCAGEGCEACSYRSPRRLGYCAFSTGGPTPEFYEVCESFVDITWRAVNAAAAQEVCNAASAVIIHCKRQSTRNAWLLEGAKSDLGRGPVVATAELLGKVARMYRLPVPFRDEDPYVWFDRVRGDQNDLLRACLLPFAGRGGRLCG